MSAGRDAERPGLIETMRLDPGGIELIDRHMLRFAMSVAALAIPADVVAVRAAIEEAAAGIRERPARLRLEVDANGGIDITWSSLGDGGDTGGSERVAILSDERLSSADPLLRHKTTRRRLYDSERRRLKDVPGGLDVLFLNERGELCEGAITNVFLELDGELVTPPVTCGLLPGVMRAHVIETRGATERILTEDDLRRAGRILLSNAVRGLVEVNLAR